MKKIFALLLVIILLVTSMTACTDNEPDDTGTTTDSMDLNNDTNNDPIDTSIKIEENADREADDNEFPFDNIIIERVGYDIASAGKYYGNDFDNVKYYGSYYRIIDNYNDFSTLTQWGNKIDEAVFEDNFVLVLHTYKNHYIYYSHSYYNKLNEKGSYNNLKANESSDSLEIKEYWSVRAAGTLDIDDYVIPELKDCKTVFPTDVQETTYLLIPKNELPSNISINGEINLQTSILVLE